MLVARRQAAGPAFDGAFAGAAALFVASQLLLFLVGLVSAPVHEVVFQSQLHQHVGGLPRFRGWAGAPTGLGTWALVALGLSRRLEPRWLRGAVMLTALGLAAASLSIATLAIPVLLALVALRGRRARWTAAGLSIAVLLVLYVRPLALTNGDRAPASWPVHPQYHRDGLGSRYMPVHAVGALGLKVHFHFTAYALLAGRGLRCLAEHPLAGVGPQRFDDRCRVMTMSTYGHWTSARMAHNQYIGWMAQTGSIGLFAVALAIHLFRRQLGWRPRDRWAMGVTAALLIAGFTWELVLSYPAAGFIALQLHRRNDPGPGPI